jgi:hypothetical protein
MTEELLSQDSIMVDRCVSLFSLSKTMEYIKDKQCIPSSKVERLGKENDLRIIKPGEASPMNSCGRINGNFWKSERTLCSQIWEIKLLQRLS